jgi:hypothetical protein
MKEEITCKKHNFKPGINGNRECMKCRHEKGLLESTEYILIPRLFDGHLHNRHIQDFKEVNADNGRVVLTSRKPYLAPFESPEKAGKNRSRDSENENFGVFREFRCFVDGWAFKVLVSDQGVNKYLDKHGSPLEDEIVPFIRNVISNKTPQ